MYEVCLVVSQNVSSPTEIQGVYFMVSQSTAVVRLPMKLSHIFTALHGVTPQKTADLCDVRLEVLSVLPKPSPVLYALKFFLHLPCHESRPVGQTTGCRTILLTRHTFLQECVDSSWRLHTQSLKATSQHARLAVRGYHYRTRISKFALGRGESSDLVLLFRIRERFIIWERTVPKEAKFFNRLSKYDHPVFVPQ
jgi:hypothetical protein